MAAFVVSVSAFTPAPVSGRRAYAGAAVRATPAAAAAAAASTAVAAAPTMAAGWSLEKYAGMAGAARGVPPARPPSSMSAFQRAFLDSLALKNAPYRAAADPEAAAARGESPAAILARDSRALAMAGLVNAGAVAMGGDATTDVVQGPTAAAADVYLAGSVRSQFKATAVPFGVVCLLEVKGAGGDTQNCAGGGGGCAGSVCSRASCCGCHGWAWGPCRVLISDMGGAALSSASRHLSACFGGFPLSSPFPLPR